MCLHWCLPWGFFLAVGYADMRIFSWPWSWFSFWQRYGLFETAFHGLSDYRSMFFSWCSHVSLSGIVVWEVNFREQQQQQWQQQQTGWFCAAPSLQPFDADWRGTVWSLHGCAPLLQFDLFKKRLSLVPTVARLSPCSIHCFLDVLRNWFSRFSSEGLGRHAPKFHPDCSLDTNKEHPNIPVSLNAHHVSLFLGCWKGSQGWRLCAVLTKVNFWSCLGQAPPERGARIGILRASQLQFVKIHRLMRTVCSDAQLAGRYSNIFAFCLRVQSHFPGCVRTTK